MPKTQTPQAEAPATPPETQAEAVQPISFEEPAAQVAEGVAFSDEKPEGFEDPKPVITAREMEQITKEAYRENDKRDFFHKIHEARQPAPDPVFTPPPLAPRVVSQTEAELAAGRALVEKHAALQAGRQPRVPDHTEGKVTPVFRPSEYVPDQKKGQGNVQARTL